jgi:hypothetical protein
LSNTWNTTAVDKFLKLVKTARDFNSKEVKLSIQDADNLALSLALILNQERELVTRLLQCQERLASRAEGIVEQSVTLTGGSFAS